MTATGIGAPVKRREDQRFITGNGRYTDDINRPGQTYAVFVRSPHAHAKIKRIDTSAAKASHGCVAVFTGKELAADKVGGLICGWMILNKDGSPMKAGGHPALAMAPFHIWPILFVTCPLLVWLIDGSAAGRWGRIVSAASVGWCRCGDSTNNIRTRWWRSWRCVCADRRSVCARC